jgi:glycosyltransferase involved in cell wall biosynthesis
MHKLQFLIASYGLQDKIIFTGLRNDVPRLISGLDLVVHASSEPEPFGLVVIESMAAGKPPVATAAGGVLDIIEDGLNGILVPCKDSKALSRAIVRLISSPSRIARMGQAARQRVIDNFTVHHQVTAIEELYDNLLNHGYIRFS